MIKLEKVTKIYTCGSETVTALDGVDFTVQDGEFVAIVGESGSGKTTLMNILGCLDSVTAGKYFLDDVAISSLPEKQLCTTRNKKIGFIFQGFNLLPNLTAIENVALPLKYRGIKKEERLRLSEAALKLVGIQHRMLHKPSELSGGQQQRVAIARVIAASPSIILADEPCGNLDSKASCNIMEILHTLNQEGTTVILITHDENAAKSVGRAVRITNGKVNV